MLPARGRGKRIEEKLTKYAWAISVVSPKKVRRVKLRSSSDSYALMPKEMLPCMLVCDATRSCHETSSKPDEVSAALLFCAKTLLRSGSRALSNSIVANSTGVLAEGRRKRPQRRAGVEMKVAKRIPKIILSSRADVQNILRRSEVPIMCLNDFSRIRGGDAFKISPKRCEKNDSWNREPRPYTDGRTKAWYKSTVWKLHDCLRQRKDGGQTSREKEQNCEETALRRT